MNDTAPIIVVNEGDKDKFEGRCSELVRQGYRLSSSSCGFVNSEQYDFCSVYQAIFVFPLASEKGS